MTSREQTSPDGSEAGWLPAAGRAGLFDILKRRVASIALVTLASLGLAIGYLAVTPHIYTASTTLLFDPPSWTAHTDGVIQGGPGPDANLIESQVPIITSGSVLGRAVDQLQLDKDAEFAPALPDGFLSQIKAMIFGQHPAIGGRARAIAQLSEAIKVKRAQQTYVVGIEVSSTSPEKAARIANAIADAYLADQTASKSAEARHAGNLIEARLGELREEVRKAEALIDEFKKANAVSASRGTNVSDQNLGNLTAELAGARAAVTEAKARLAQTSAMTRGPFTPGIPPEAGTSGLLRKLREQYVEVAQREAALSSQLQEKHPLLVETRSQLAEINAQIGLELKRIAAAAKGEYQVARLREQSLQETLERVQERAAQANAHRIKLDAYERAAEASREMLRAFLAQAKETQDRESASTPEARVVSQATVPGRPARPPGALTLALALLGGLGLGVARALAAGRRDRSLRTNAGGVTLGGFSLAGTLPMLKRKSVFARLGQLFHPADSDGVRKDYDDVLAAVSDTSGKVAPGYRQAVLRLLTRLRAGTEPGEQLTLLFAGPNQGAGSSSTALAVAYAAVLGGDRVLFVDAASANAGLTGAFAGNRDTSGSVMADDQEQLGRIAVTDGRTGLTFLPIALIDMRTLKGEQRRRLAAGVTDLSQGYDLTIIDAGPLVEDQSATCLVPAADRIALVGRAGETTREALALLAEVLEPAADRIAGVILDGA